MADQANPTQGPMDPATLLTQVMATQQHSNHTMNQLAGVFNQYMQIQANQANQPSKTMGPKIKEPRSYEGDRSNGKLDDHIRDLKNWVGYYEKRHHWNDEAEKVTQSSTFLNGRIHQIFQLQKDSISTFPDYVLFLERTFRDNNEQFRLRDEWQQLNQGTQTVLEYASDVIFLSAKIVPAKAESEIKEHFRVGLKPSINIRFAENPEWNDLSFDSFIAKADMIDQIEAEKEYLRKKAGLPVSDRAFLIQGAHRGGRRPSALTRRPRKGTPEWQDFCRSTNACFNCGKEGHSVRNCSQPLDNERPKLQDPALSRSAPRRGQKKVTFRKSGKGRT